MQSTRSIRPKGPVIAAASFFMLMTSGLGATYVVSTGGALSTISDGINAAGANDTVIVKSGTYQENVVIPAGKNGLKLTAKGKVIIEARAAGGVGKGPGIQVGSADVSITGFIIRNAADQTTPFLNGYGISCDRNGLTIEDFTITGCVDEAVVVNSGNKAKLLDCDFFANDGGIYISGNKAVITRVTIRNDDAGQIEIDGDDATVKKCTVRVSETDAIRINGINPRVENNKIYDVDGNGIYINNGTGARVLNNDVYGAYNEGIELANSPDSVIKGNTVCESEAAGLYASNCTNSKIQNNTVMAVMSYGIDCGSNDCTISGNVIRYGDDEGIDANGTGNVIENNTVEYVQGDGIYSYGENVTIRKNSVQHCFDDTHGIYLGGTTTIGLIEANTISYCADSAIYFSTTAAGVLVTDNKIKACGVGDANAAIRVRGSNHKIRNNSIKDCGGDSISVEGNGHKVQNNEIDGSGRDGIDVESGTGNLVKGNTVTDCGAEGIENNGTNTTVTGNTARRNRIDFADDGSGAVFAANKSSDGTHSTPATPEID